MLRDAGSAPTRGSKPAAADVSADALDDLASARAADVLLLVEIPDCEWCAATRPAFRQLAKSRASTDPARRACARSRRRRPKIASGRTNTSPRTASRPSSPPRRGGVYKYGGDDRSVPFISAFADQAFSAAHSAGAPPRSASAEALSPASPRRRSRAPSPARSLAPSARRPPGSPARPRTRSRRTRWSPRASPCSRRRRSSSSAERSAAARDGRAGSRLDAAGAFGRGGPGAAEVSPRGPPPP